MDDPDPQHQGISILCLNRSRLRLRRNRLDRMFTTNCWWLFSFDRGAATVFPVLQSIREICRGRLISTQICSPTTAGPRVLMEEGIANASSAVRGHLVGSPDCHSVGCLVGRGIFLAGKLFKKRAFRPSSSACGGGGVTNPSRGAVDDLRVCVWEIVGKPSVLLVSRTRPSGAGGCH